VRDPASRNEGGPPQPTVDAMAPSEATSVAAARRTAAARRVGTRAGCGGACRRLPSLQCGRSQMSPAEAQRIMIVPLQLRESLVFSIPVDVAASTLTPRSVTYLRAY